MNSKGYMAEFLLEEWLPSSCFDVNGLSRSYLLQTVHGSDTLKLKIPHTILGLQENFNCFERFAGRPFVRK
jgi:hypothetical protein